MNDTATPPAAPKDIPTQFAELAAQYEALVRAIDPAKGPQTHEVLMLMFARVQMIDLKIDMLAIGLGKAGDPNKPRIVVPGRRG